MKQVAHQMNMFALDLYRKLKEQEGNLFLSPFSISICLAMVYAGARSETEKQMAKVLHFSLHQQQLHEELGCLLENMRDETKKRGYELHIANALWGQKGYRFFTEFLELLKKWYRSELRELDFETDIEAVCQSINQWIEKNTKKKIRNILQPNMLDLLTRLVLTNAIYFKGFWRSPFEEDMTCPAPFRMKTRPFGSNEVDVLMMVQTGHFGYAEEDGIQVLEMLYEGQELAMVIFLPRKVDGLQDFERSLTAENLTKLLRIIQPQEVKVFLPKFRYTSEFVLSRVLQSLGMNDAFSRETADFSGMTDREDLAISEVIHKAFVEVNEEGTEAAAVTAMAVLAAAEEEPETDVPVFRADHPFLFMIRDIRAESVLFIRRVDDPRAFEQDV